MQHIRSVSEVLHSPRLLYQTWQTLYQLALDAPNRISQHPLVGGSHFVNRHHDHLQLCLLLLKCLPDGLLILLVSRQLLVELVLVRAGCATSLEVNLSLLEPCNDVVDVLSLHCVLSLELLQQNLEVPVFLNEVVVGKGQLVCLLLPMLALHYWPSLHRASNLLSAFPESKSSL